jgi:hypothetical protein
MPMPINNSDEFDKVVNVSWYTPAKSREELRLERHLNPQAVIANQS